MAHNVTLIAALLGSIATTLPETLGHTEDLNDGLRPARFIRYEDLEQALLPIDPETSEDFATSDLRRRLAGAWIGYWEALEVDAERNSYSEARSAMRGCGSRICVHRDVS